MPMNLTWSEVILRLVLTFAAGAIIGVNRGEHGRAAGLRTTILLCLAAAVAMIQANLLLITAGKTPSSFSVLDLMRLPLGILTGVGFIGAGAILRKDNMVVGVTTAATLWFVTVMGLCFGGGQLGLGLIALALCLLTLWGLKWVEEHRKQVRHGTIIVTVEASGPDKEQISQLAGNAGYQIRSWSVTYFNDLQKREYNCAVNWRAHPSDVSLPSFVEPLSKLPGVSKLVWNPLLYTR